MSATGNIEITEDAAEGRTREIYRDMRACFEAPIVNLIYRRIAAIPGGLDWAWGTLRPQVAGGALADAAEDMLLAVDLGTTDLLPEERLETFGIDGPAIALIRDVLDAYNRSNPMNVIAVRTLSHALEAGRPATPFRVAETMTSDTEPTPLPPLIDYAEADPAVRDAAARLGRYASGGSNAIVPTLFRHFGACPGFVRLAAEIIAPLARSSALSDAVARLDGATQTASQRMIQSLGKASDGIPAPVGQPRDELRGLLTLFPPAICGMIVIGRTLRAALPSNGSSPCAPKGPSVTKQ